ncbi:MAG: response regulator [Desulfobacterales bacterium]|jgi:CheY-like chemotaxis protein
MKNENKIYVWQNNKDRRDQVIDGIMIEGYDRRQEDDPNYNGPERRSGEDRRSAENEKIIMLVTENPDDERLVLGAFQKNNIVNKVVVARDGAEALYYLFGSGIYANSDGIKRPHVILLDLNLQKIDGLEVLRRLHHNERTNLLPLVVFISSEDDRDLTEYYNYGVNSFIRKPADSEQFDGIIRQLDQYWLVLNEPPPQEKELMNKPIRVLIVEDSDDDALLIVRQLKKEGYRPIYDQVDTAEAMRKAFEKQAWDVILCDNSMPGFSAFDALSIYKEKMLDLPFIIVSGAIVYENAAAIMEAGAHDYILKNDLAELSPAIDRAFSMLKNRQVQ